MIEITVNSNTQMSQVLEEFASFESQKGSL